MRKLIIGIALLSSTFFYACKEKATNHNTTTSIEGIWAGKEYTTTVKTATSQLLQTANQYTKATTYTFNGDGTFIEKVAAFESSGDWILNDSNILTLKYRVKQGPQDRTENMYKVVTQNDSLLILEFKLQEYGVENYIFSRKN